jgi:hypothetical protein
MNRIRRKQAIDSLGEYVSSSTSMVLACIGGSDSNEKCLDPTTVIPNSVIQQFKNIIQPFQTLFTGRIFVSNSFFNPNLTNLKLGSTFKFHSILMGLKQQPTNKMNSLTYKHILEVSNIPILDLSLFQKELPWNLRKQNLILLIPNTLCTVRLKHVEQKYKQIRETIWEMVPSESQILPITTTSQTKNNPTKVIEQLRLFSRFANQINLSLDPNLKICKDDQFTFEIPTDLKYHQVSNIILSLRYLAKPITSVVFRGTYYPIPFFSRKARTFPQEQMTIGMKLHLNHPLSTSIDETIAIGFSSKSIQINWNKTMRKPQYIHEFRLEQIPCILVPSFAHQLREDFQRSLAIGEQEVLILPDYNLVFTLIEIHSHDTHELLPFAQKPIGYVATQSFKKTKTETTIDEVEETVVSNVLKTTSNPNTKKVRGGQVRFVWKVTLKPNDLDQKRIIVKSLHSIYNTGFAFPKWIHQYDYELWPHLDFHATRVYFDKSIFKQKDIRRLLLEREPCNIAMTRYYNQSRMQQLFGWSTSFYSRYFEQTQQLPPNIAVYVRTPIFGDGFKTKSIHLLNLVGMAFDSKKQPDAQFYRTPTIETLQMLYLKVWRKAFVCARDLGVARIVPVVVGGGAFTPIDPIQFKTNVHDIVLNKLKEEFPYIEVLHIPTNVFETIEFMTTIDRNNTLFINAWDPHTILGNGNAKDNSLDGHFGRRTPIAILGWPATNNHITYHSI